MLEQIIYERYDEVDSTNERIKDRAHQGAGEGLVISADYQNAGKGRIGRSWKNPSAESVATSILLRPSEVPIEAVPSCTIISAMAVTKMLEDIAGIKAEIKWPNDVVVGKKKICGILHEMELKDGKVWYVVAGIGINVHNSSFPEEIAFKATSIDMEIEKMGQKKDFKLEDIEHLIWENFKVYYNKFLETYDLSKLREEYESKLANKGNRVRIEDPKGAYEAICKGINNKGALIVEVDGQIKEIDSGEVSVRGLYGYV